MGGLTRAYIMLGVPISMGVPYSGFRSMGVPYVGFPVRASLIVVTYPMLINSDSLFGVP